MKSQTILALSTLALACSTAGTDPPGTSRARLEESDGGADSGVACAHSTCAAGIALIPSCDACATTVCTADPYCCQVSWDETCVGEGKSLCAQSCTTPVLDSGTGDSGTSACSHPVCTAGSALVASCDACAQAVCGADAYCCSGGWDATCVGEAVSICGVQCP
jgi:hypothetical protein